MNPVEMEDGLAWDFSVGYYMNYIYIYYEWLLLASVCYLWDLLLVMIGYWMI
jgi:hypothetical protein